MHALLAIPGIEDNFFTLTLFLQNLSKPSPTARCTR